MNAPSIRATLILGLFALTSSGCLVMSNSTEKRSGKYVSQPTYEQIEPGKTTASWVLATLGEPSTKTQATGSEVWKYQYSETHDSGKAIFLVFMGNDRKETTGTTYVEIKDNLVANAWRE